LEAVNAEAIFIDRLIDALLRQAKERWAAQ
jgi:hypothetical protein